jgi:hypothetical protein
VAAELLGPGQQLIVKRHGGAHGPAHYWHQLRRHLMTPLMR